MSNTPILSQLKTKHNIEVYTDETSRIIYSTDASAYKEMPLGVAFPKNKDEIQKIIQFASQNNIPIIPRTAGTSLAGQVVGNGLVVDVSKHLTKIIEFNKDEKWIKVQPGVVLDELNIFLKPHGLYFGPETSTSSRCMIGGMVGNNSCGARSLIYGSTRNHTLEITAFLSDASEVIFKELTKNEFAEKLKLETLEGKIYRQMNEILSDKEIQTEINSQFPDKKIERRNTGYAIDILADSEIFSENFNQKFNFCNLLAGSEGTLAFTTEIKLNLVELPPKKVALICVHTKTLKEAFYGNLVALKHSPTSIELMDKAILELTKANIEQNKNRFFVEGNPEAILIVEFAKNTKEELETAGNQLIADLKKAEIGYHFPVIFGTDIAKVWNLRKAGLGVLSNMPGDAKPVPVIEDTAVNPEHLPQYIEELQEILKKYNLSCIYYAHIATGELHLRPVLNLKAEKDVELFHQLALEVALLVKKFNGSLSGEHGDGRLRGEFIPLMLGEKIYQIFKDIKHTWDEKNIFNPNKIVDTPKMNTNLRFAVNQKTQNVETFFDFSASGGYLQTIEKCNGSGDCRKTEIIGKTMCPSFMASKDEEKTTRARANLLREILNNKSTAVGVVTNSSELLVGDNTNNGKLFDHKELYDILDTCLSCKACKTECPSSVDMAKIKAEFLQQYYLIHSPSMRTRLIANYIEINKLMSIFPRISNFVLKNRFTSTFVKHFTGFAQQRNLPTLSTQKFSTFYKNFKANSDNKKSVYLFIDEFTKYNESEIGIKCVKLLDSLGYRVIIPDFAQSGRTFLSKGFLKRAKVIANKNVEIARKINTTAVGVVTNSSELLVGDNTNKGIYDDFNLMELPSISAETPLIGIEPSAILTFRDEYQILVDQNLKEFAQEIAKHTFTIEEFLSSEFEKGNINQDLFTDEKREFKIHGHCHQKSISAIAPTLKMVSIPRNYSASEIPSGCCGMAGSFGFEKEHYQLSMQVGNLKLFPEIKTLNSEITVVAAGTSCRQQIKDGTQKQAFHPVEVLFEALKNENL